MSGKTSLNKLQSGVRKKSWFSLIPYGRHRLISGLLPRQIQERLLEITWTERPIFECDSKFFGKVLPQSFDLYRNLNSDPPFRDASLKQHNDFAPLYEGDVELAGDRTIISISVRLRPTVLAFLLIWHLVLIVAAIGSLLAGIQGRLLVEPYVPALTISGLLVVGLAGFNVPFHLERRKGITLLKEKLEAKEDD